MPRKTRSQTGLVAWLTETDCPVFVLDERRRVRFFNRGCVELTGCQPGDVIGKPCDYLIDPLAGLSERILHAIAPPAEVFGGQELFTSIEFIDARGAARKQHVFYLPLPGEGGRIPVVLGVMLDFHDVPRQLLPHATQQLHVDLTHLLAQQTHHFQASTLIARGPAMLRVTEQLKLARKSELPLHVHGPAGSGKVYLLQVLQAQLPGTPPLIPIACRLLPRSEQRRLLKDVLANFRDGRETAGLLLKDVDLLAEDLQSWLAELFAGREWPRSVRLFSTSRIALSRQVEEGRFHRELYFAMTPQSIELPGLRERSEDFELLAQFFIEQGNATRETQMTGLDQRTLDELRGYEWKGNVAELKKMLEEAQANCPGPYLLPEHLPFRWQTGKLAQATPPQRTEHFEPLEDILECLERQEIQRALAHARNNKAKAAELLGLTRPKLYRRIEQLGLLPESPSEETETAS